MSSVILLMCYSLWGRHVFMVSNVVANKSHLVGLKNADSRHGCKHKSGLPTPTAGLFLTDYDRSHISAILTFLKINLICVMGLSRHSFVVNLVNGFIGFVYLYFTADLRTLANTLC